MIHEILNNCINFQVIDRYLNKKDKKFCDTQARIWSDEICGEAIKALRGLKKPFKYCVSCVLVEKNGTGLNSSATCYWDTKNDGISTIQWPSRLHTTKQIENDTVNAVVTVYAIKFT